MFALFIVLWLIVGPPSAIGLFYIDGNNIMVSDLPMIILSCLVGPVILLILVGGLISILWYKMDYKLNKLDKVLIKFER